MKLTKLTDPGYYLREIPEEEYSNLPEPNDDCKGYPIEYAFEVIYMEIPYKKNKQRY